MSDEEPVAVIVGGGFGRLAAAKALKRTPARVILLDRTNHHFAIPAIVAAAKP